MRLYLKLALAVVAVVLLGQVPACAKDSNGPPPRQDGWIFYLHPSGPLSYFTGVVSFDSAGGKWVNHQGGLSYLDDNGTPLDVTDDSWFTYDRFDGACGSMSVLDAADGKWLGVTSFCHHDDSGTPLDKSDDASTRFSQSDGMTLDTVSIIEVDPSGGIWLGSVFEGVDYLQHNGTPLNKSDDLWVHFDSRDGLGDTGAIAIAVEPGKGIWFGHFAGVSFLDYGASPLAKADDQWVTYDTTDGLVFPRVTSIAIDSAGRKWFGTWDGVSCLDDGGTPLFNGDDQWMTFRIKRHPKYYNIVRSMGIDLNGGKWFATDRTGVFYLDDGGTPFDKSDDYSYYSGEKNGLADNWVSSVTIDSSNGKWVGTRRGLCYLP